MTRLKVSFRKVLKPGYRRAYAAPETVPDPSLVGARVGQVVRAAARAERQSGLSEAALLKRLQRQRVGRPSTYADILAALRRHRYINEARGKLSPTPRGLAALDWLTAHYPQLFDIRFSARLEGLLDDLAEGQRAYREVVQTVWDLLN